MTPPRLTFARPLSILARPDGLQVGLDADDAILLIATPPGTDAVLRALRHPRTLLEVSRLVPAVPRTFIEALVATLVAAGVLHAVDSPTAARVTVLGTGPLAGEVTRLLSAEGFAVSERSTPCDGALHVVCSDTAEPDRVLTRDLAASGLPHLVVRTEPERAVVGPFVVPGTGPCVGCTDLVRRDLDPGFPHLLAQLCRAEHTPTPRQGAWAAAMASAQVGAWQAGRTPEACGATLELDAHTGSLGVRRWPRHPDCGCSLAAA